MTTLIAEDLLLLLLDDESGRLRHSTYLDTGIGGALLVELALTEAVEAVPQEKKWGWTPSARIRASGAMPADEVLREALAVVSEKERTAEDLVGRLGRKRKEPLLERLVARGVVRREEGRALGLFPTTSWPEADGRHEAELREQLRAVLLDGAEPDERTGGLVALLSAMDLAHQVVDREGRPAREVKKRAKEVADGDWGATAVKDAIASAQAAVTAAVTVAVTAGATSGSS